MSNLSKKDYLQALRKLEKSPSDRIGSLGKIGVAATGAGAGALGAGAIASFFGATTILGSTGLASLAGGVLVAATPVGWILGTAAAGTAAAYGISQLVSSGGVNDERKKATVTELKAKIDFYAKEAKKTKSADKIGKVAGAYALLLENNLMEQTKITAILSGIEDGNIDSNYALTIAQDMLKEIQEATKKDLEPKSDNMAVRSSFVLLYKHLMRIDGIVSESELVTYYKMMNKTFKCPKKYAKQLLNEAPSLKNVKNTLEEVKNIIPKDKHELLTDSLVVIAYSDGEYHPKEQAFIKKIKKAFQA